MPLIWTDENTPVAVRQVLLKILVDRIYFTGELRLLGSVDSIDSDADSVSGKTITTNLIPGEKDGRWDAGMYTIE